MGPQCFFAVQYVEYWDANQKILIEKFYPYQITFSYLVHWNQNDEILCQTCIDIIDEVYE